jgi:hypothetical protein
MLSLAEFRTEWNRLETRFGRDHNEETLDAYYEFLAPLMDTAAFLAAAHTVWATFKWWPRPADFLTLAAQGEWPLVVQCVEGYRPPDWPWTTDAPDGTIAPWKRLSERSRGAVKQMGGIDAVKAAYERDPIRAKDAWEKALEQATADEVLRLSAAGTFKALPAPVP